MGSRRQDCLRHGRGAGQAPGDAAVPRRRRSRTSASPEGCLPAAWGWVAESAAGPKSEPDGCGRATANGREFTRMPEAGGGGWLMVDGEECVTGCRAWQAPGDAAGPRRRRSRPSASPSGCRERRRDLLSPTADGQPRAVRRAPGRPSPYPAHGPGRARSPSRSGATRPGYPRPTAALTTGRETTRLASRQEPAATALTAASATQRNCLRFNSIRRGPPRRSPTTAGVRATICT